jgi:branched-chain amino acid transport system substrate-binding protein
MISLKFRVSAHRRLLRDLVLIGIVSTALLAGPPELSGAEPIKIASIYALSGSAVQNHYLSARGVRLAVNDINTSGGILGRSLELLEFDSRSTPIGSKVAADLARKHQVTAIIGAGYSSHSMAVAKVAQKHGIPMITSVSTYPAITRIGDYIFRTCFNDAFQGEVMGTFVREELGIEQVAICFNLTSDYSLGFSSTFETSFVAAGGVITARLPYKLHQPRFREVLDQAKTMKPQAIFIAGHDESARIAQLAIQNGIQAVMLGGDGWDSVGFFTNGGQEIELGYYSTHWSRSFDAKRSRQFVARHGQDEQILAPTALAYDAVMLLGDAIRRAGTSLRAAVKDALAQTKGFKGVTGTISFDSHGDSLKSVVIMKIVKGVPKYHKRVSPDVKD